MSMFAYSAIIPGSSRESLASRAQVHRRTMHMRGVMEDGRHSRSARISCGKEGASESCRPMADSGRCAHWGTGKINETLRSEAALAKCDESDDAPTPRTSPSFADRSANVNPTVSENRQMHNVVQNARTTRQCTGRRGSRQHSIGAGSEFASALIAHQDNGHRIHLAVLIHGSGGGAAGGHARHIVRSSGWALGTGRTDHAQIEMCPQWLVQAANCTAFTWRFSYTVTHVIALCRLGTQ
ncbi:hypothetical protein GGX14DRAFT_388666 [Mycena pura]|uniref:Uncharacterized protein n=1 Tax=Mycena pura TaxID=153505 RepID=A0AAD6VVU4_9AGAR|nr:hypothetical protein GGX14DRAFT_388666 [Mycena pura]